MGAPSRRDPSTSTKKLSVRAEADELQRVRIWLPVDQQQIRSEVALATVVPRSRQRMISVRLRQRSICCQRIDNARHELVYLSAMLPGLLPFEVPLECTCVLNRPRHLGPP